MFEAATELRSILRLAARQLPGDESLREAEILIGHVLGLSRAGLFAQGERALDDDELAHCRRLIQARADGEPVAYLLGTREFWSLPLRVTPDVLIPRHETELLVTIALTHIPADGAGLRVLDLGTGSGAVALALAKEKPRLEVWAIDQSQAALDVAEANARSLALPQVRFLLSDWFSALDADLKFNLIVSNPPYVAADDPHLLQGDLRFEPRLALTPGGDGLQAIEHISRRSPMWLKPHGCLLFEHGYDQAAAVRDCLAQTGFAAIESHSDEAGRDRVTLGRLR